MPILKSIANLLINDPLIRACVMLTKSRVAWLLMACYTLALLIGFVQIKTGHSGPLARLTHVYFDAYVSIVRPTPSNDIKTRSNADQEKVGIPNHAKPETQRRWSESAKAICAEYPDMKVCKDFNEGKASSGDVFSCFAPGRLGYKVNVPSPSGVEEPLYPDCGAPAFLKSGKSAGFFMGLAYDKDIVKFKTVPIQTTPEAQKAATEVASIAAGVLNGFQQIERVQDKDALLVTDQEWDDLALIETTFFSKVIDAKRKQEISAGTVVLFNLVLKTAQEQRVKTIASMAAECEGYQKAGKKHLPYWCYPPAPEPAIEPNPTPGQ